MDHVEYYIEHPDTDEIWVVEFDAKSALEFNNKVSKLAIKDPNKPIVIRIYSYGGQVDALASMLNTMDSVPNRFITVSDGCAMSCGAILLSHGDIRFCSPLSRIMIHNVQSGSWGDAYCLKAESEETMRLNKVFMSLLAKNCGISYEELQNRIKNAVGAKEIWLSPEDAKKFGIIDVVGVPHVTPITQWHFPLMEKKPQIVRKKVKKDRKNNRK